MKGVDSVGVIMGGPSDEHDVSLASGRQVLNALGPAGVPVVIGRDGIWSVGGERLASLGAAIDALQARIDVAFIALHGPFGEDGTIQGVLETAGIRYTGSGVMASALAMDKARTKFIYRDQGLPTPAFVAFTDGSDRAERLQKVARDVGYPCVVKPSCNGSSFGVSFPKDRTALESALDAFEGESLVEAFIRGREFTCGVIVDRAGTGVEALPVTEIIPDAKYEFFDYEAKYTPGASQEIAPADISPELTKEIQALSIRAHRALGCRGMSRTDFMTGPDDEVFLIETNTIPGLTENSLLPKGARAAGLEFSALISRLVQAAR